MNVHASNFRDLAAAEFDTATLLAHAAEQAIERRAAASARPTAHIRSWAGASPAIPGAVSRRFRPRRTATSR
jgi:hypothetical protein